MSYDLQQVFARVFQRLSDEPLLSLTALAQELRISRNTLAKAVHTCGCKGLRELRSELLLTRTRAALSSERLWSVKELSYNAGYKSPRAFARAIRRVYGCTPQQLRASACDRGGLRLHRARGKHELRGVEPTIEEMHKDDASVLGKSSTGGLSRDTQSEGK
jgi:AraC-like DNA-binding protein